MEITNQRHRGTMRADSRLITPGSQRETRLGGGRSNGAKGRARPWAAREGFRMGWQVVVDPRPIRKPHEGGGECPPRICLVSLRGLGKSYRALQLNVGCNVATEREPKSGVDNFPSLALDFASSIHAQKRYRLKPGLQLIPAPLSFCIAAAHPACIRAGR